jgi:Rrf2 family transcriptional regulator, cysteine metabolism repressor
MKLSAKGDYAFRALMDLVGSYNQHLVLAREISQNHNIPEKFLEQILRELKNAGYVYAKPGVNGGYALSKAPDQITFGEIVRLMEGPIDPIGCISKTHYVPCQEEFYCKFQMVMCRVRDAVSEILDNTTLADVAGNNVPSQNRSKEMYYI